MCTWKRTSASCWTSECECLPGEAEATSEVWGPGRPALTVLLHRLRIGPADVLTFYDGDDLTARVLGQYSGPRGHVKLFTSMADVTIQFQSDPGTSVLGYQQGFVIHFFGELIPASLRTRAPNHSRSEARATRGLGALPTRESFRCHLKEAGPVPHLPCMPSKRENPLLQQEGAG